MISIKILGGNINLTFLLTEQRTQNLSISNFNSYIKNEKKIDHSFFSVL